MDFIKKNRLLISILGIFLILLGGSIYLLNRKIEEQRTVNEDLQQKIEQRRNLWNRKPFPSKENVNRIHDFAAEGEVLVGDLLKVLRKGSLSFDRVSGSSCKALILEARRRMTELLFQNEIKFPNKFQFGFERYDIRPPDDNDTPIIQKQLKVIEELIKLIAEARCQEITSLRRVEFENSRDSIAPSSTRYNPTSAPLLSMGNDFNNLDLPNYIYTVMPFELEIQGDTNSLRAFLNALSRSSYIFLPRILNIENERKEATTGKEWGTTKSSSQSAVAIDKSVPLQTGHVPEGINEVTRVDPEELPFVFGEEKIKVGIRIEWFEFRTAPSKPNKHKK